MSHTPTSKSLPQPNPGQTQAENIVDHIAAGLTAMAEEKQDVGPAELGPAEQKGAAQNAPANGEGHQEQGGDIGQNPAAPQPNKVVVRDRLKLSRLRTILPAAVRTFLEKHDTEVASNGVEARGTLQQVRRTRYIEASATSESSRRGGNLAGDPRGARNEGEESFFRRRLQRPVLTVSHSGREVKLVYHGAGESNT